jgi:hypothetical protein
MAILEVDYSTDNLYMLKQGYFKPNFEILGWSNPQFPKVSWKIRPVLSILIVHKIVLEYVRYAAYCAEKSYGKLDFRLKMTGKLVIGLKNENRFSNF